MPDAFISADADADALSGSFLGFLGRFLALSWDILAVSYGFLGFLGISLVFLRIYIFLSCGYSHLPFRYRSAEGREVQRGSTHS